MKRNVDPDYEFDKVRFAETLKNAIGDRSIAEFARDAGISAGYVSRYVNLKVDVTPTLATIQKMNSATTAVPYEEFLEAAGYDPAKYDDEADQEIAELSPEWSPMNALLPTFCKLNFKWRFLSPNSNGKSYGPISAMIEEAPFNMWYFIPVIKENIVKEDIISVLGSEEAEIIKQDSKVTFLTTSKATFDVIAEMELNLISIRVSVAYIKPSQITITEEKYLKTAVKLGDIDKIFMLTNYENRYDLLSI